MKDGNDYTPTRDEVVGAAVGWFYEYGIAGVNLSDTDLTAMVERGLSTQPSEPDHTNGTQT